MSEFRGILQIRGSQSSVNGDILLMAGDQDPDQAMSGATSFVKRKGFQSGFSIIVTGSMGQVGTVSGIIMTNAAAPSVAAPTVTAMAEATARMSVAPALRISKKPDSRKKRPAAKKKKAAPKKGARRVAKRKSAKKANRIR